MIITLCVDSYNTLTILCVFRRMRQNRLINKYSPVLKGRTLTSDAPAKPAHYTRERKDDEEMSSVLTPKDTGVYVLLGVLKINNILSLTVFFQLSALTIFLYNYFRA